MPEIRPRFFLLVALLTLLSGCSLIDYYFLPPPEDTAQELYEAGVYAMNDGDYGDAAEYFMKLKDNYPFSPFTPKAEVGLGDAYFLNEQYILAADAYKEFEALHPMHEDTPYVLFQVGMSNFKQFESIDRRQDNIREGIEYFQRVVDGYPDTDFAVQAKQYIHKSRRILAEHELFVADFYWRTEKYGPAWSRYKYVVENYPDLPEIHEYARRRAEYSYYEHQKTLSEEERMRLQESWYKFIRDWL
ncbi:Beta-barrel assembly machine subunit BamD [Paucidesulfovibrio gracilis DSM 16080]|uniref:Beta-barrel assembly machine subunit BamD n=1 Tax=Paucidesulfovibrio gracilis DSM 16080 TaxID=1121449 RepID=A0A1T4WTN9_9BACT|nr:outer membrane protein assembly factor BamD [Paucidesulfovibrio gracilis]SKA80218.1 Beta-barrel assembly machine subunit BamD [Paucidesulfovibrio gracilis DSM 16080]